MRNNIFKKLLGAFTVFCASFFIGGVVCAENFLVDLSVDAPMNDTIFSHLLGLCKDRDAKWLLQLDGLEHETLPVQLPHDGVVQDWGISSDGSKRRGSLTVEYDSGTAGPWISVLLNNAGIQRSAAEKSGGCFGDRTSCMVDCTLFFGESLQSVSCKCKLNLSTIRPAEHTSQALARRPFDPPGLGHGKSVDSLPKRCHTRRVNAGHGGKNRNRI